jgi:hypothetical protein
MFHALQMYVACVSSECCKIDLVLHMLQWICTCVASIYFKRMLQVFHLDVAYVAAAINVCCKSVFPNVSVVSSRCRICCSGYTRMLQLYVLNFSPILDRCCKCFICILLYVVVVIHICCKRMFQLLHLVSMLQQMLLPTRSDPRARTCCTHLSSAVYLCRAGQLQ